LTEEKKADVIDKITVSMEQLQRVINALTPYYPFVKIGARLLGVKIPPEIDQAIDALKKGEMPDLASLEALGEGIDRKVGEPVLTRDLAEEAWYLHHKEGMGTREIADYFTNERKSPCSHATVARYINMIDLEKKASRIGSIVRVVKYAGIVGLCLLCTYIGHLLW